MLKVTAVILAGGQSSRMGHDKGLMELQGKPLINHVAQALQKTDELLVNSENLEYAALGFTLIEDLNTPDVPAQSGPLLGVFSGLKQAENDWVLFSPCDTPLIPNDYATRMSQFASDRLTKACVAYDGDRQQNLHVLLHKSLADSLQMYLLSGRRKTYEWLASVAVDRVDFSAEAKLFRNINTPMDLQLLSNELSTKQ
ncbi:molybdenum cofactor guanylyltransferase [Bermanella marisrubri]|uniref:Molybdenum cofactor guanylyltransferase n=1 Tax=Bermanella marisrubri TaxID=207949 RepID=Q1N141_9GAMM|nr:molybdenum cofactor guanylyltransferase MobA [Bermanella marisrubri]EAT12010.1 molybdopterin-guanine dinucleotide biosynthesis protein A [Oceanobacter sp. RED65] [Bermanella marisrubri]QIZ84815.1 molybdenum cofactor guanylyltransferase [Bermanella marisrubri]